MLLHTFAVVVIVVFLLAVPTKDTHRWSAIFGTFAAIPNRTLSTAVVVAVVVVHDKFNSRWQKQPVRTSMSGNTLVNTSN